MPRYDYLMKPLTVAGLTLKNRLLSAPTSMAELGPEEQYTDENFDYYRLRAAGGAALVTVGDVIVDNATGRSHPQQLGMDDPSVISSLKKWLRLFMQAERRHPLSWIMAVHSVIRLF